MPHHARNHNQNRRRVCIVCVNKGNDTIAELVMSRIHKHVKGLEHYSTLFPTGKDLVLTGKRVEFLKG